MRPTVLQPLFQSVTQLKGVGPAVHKQLMQLLGRSLALQQNALVRDLLFHLPTGVTDRRNIVSLNQVCADAIHTVIVTVVRHQPPPPGKRSRVYRVLCEDEHNTLQLVFFHGNEKYLKQQLPEGQQRIISGRIELFDGQWQMVHPDIIAPVSELENVCKLDVNYPLTQELSPKKLRTLIAQAVSLCPQLPEWQQQAIIKDRGWGSFNAALQQLHQPQSVEDILPEASAYQRLAYDELLANQLALAIVRRVSMKKAGCDVVLPSQLRDSIIAALPFQLTESQQQVIEDIDGDYASGQRMIRLLQGDVGSGKTVVSLMAMAPVIEAGYQAALMAPTEILARQHFTSLSPLFEAVGLRAVLLTGSLPAAQRKQAEEAIASGEAQIAIGTHALFQQRVQFHKLGLAVIDEQHRFGVGQRLSLAAKGERTHLLLMTATPIPRSLTMTAYGDMASSQLRGKPAGRKPIETKAITLPRINEVIEAITRRLQEGHKVYWICPLVEESQQAFGFTTAKDIAAAEQRYQALKSIFGERVGLAHGRMHAEDRQASMQQFAQGSSDILVATTVVEVGVDVPEASIIVIEHAERFGLAQLHQLRGRVGRGEVASHCLLLYDPDCTDVARERLKIIRRTNDGFEIAEEDLRLRGSGDVLGTRQSGLPQFRIADVVSQQHLLRLAHDDVKWIMHHDPELASERGQALRVLLYLFEYDQSLQWLKAG